MSIVNFVDYCSHVKLKTNSILFYPFRGDEKEAKAIEYIILVSCEKTRENNT